VQVIGSNFGSVAAAVNATISGVPCVVLSAGDTGVICRTRVMAGGLVTFAVGNQSAIGAAVTFNPAISLPTASVLSVTHASGGASLVATVGLPLSGGGSVAVGGNNLVPNAPAKGVIMRTGSVWAGDADCSGALAVLNASLTSNVCLAGSVTWNPTSVSCTLPPSRTALVYLSVVTVVGDACKSYTQPMPVLYDPPRVARVAAAGGSGGSAALSTHGGTRILLIGKNFPKDTCVFVGGVVCAGVDVYNDTALACTAPPGAGTNVTVSLNSSAYPGFGVLQLPRLAYQAPIVGSVTPNSSPAVGGTLLQISGSNFAEGWTSVAVGPYPAVVGLRVSASGGDISVVVPAGHGAHLNVTVTVGNQSTTLSDAFSYSQPTVYSTLPSVLDGANGGAVIINGSNFVPLSVPVSAVQVWINQVPCTGAVRVSDATLSCTAPPILVSHAAEVLVKVDGASGQGLTRVACLAGSFGPSDGAKCAACPMGALCPGFDDDPLPLAGFSRVSEAVFVSCVPPESCVGLDSATTRSRRAAGVTAAADVYANCATGYCDNAGGYGLLA
jgi:hypothetical protein